MVWKILLLVPLSLLALALALVLLALLTRVQLRVFSDPEQTTLRLKLGFWPWSILLFPRPEKKPKKPKKAQKAKKPKKPKKPKESKKPAPASPPADTQSPPQAQAAPREQTAPQPPPAGEGTQTRAPKKTKGKSKGLGSLPPLELLFEMLQEGVILLERMFSFDKLMVEVYIATDDVAQTGILLGAASAGAGMLLPALQSRYVIRRLRVILDADFDQRQTRWQVDIRIRTRLVIALVHGLGKYKTIQQWIKKWKTVEKENEYEHTSHR